MAKKKAGKPKKSSRRSGSPQRPDAGQARQPSPHAPAPPPAVPVVGVGASAGGLEALEELLENMPADTGMAFVIVTHQHPGHASLLPGLLAKHTEMQVAEAFDGAVLAPNHVYVCPPAGNLAVYNGVLYRLESTGKELPRLPIDYFFRSLAEDQRQRAICVVLSGTGADGTLGLQAVKAESGMAMVQQPQSAKYTGMPSSAIATGLVDFVLPPAAMPQQLVAYARGPYLASAAVAGEPPAVPAEPMEKIFVLLRSRTGHDFSAYKSNTLRRRIERRMNIHQIGGPDQYVRYLQENPYEIDVLFKEMLISVTNFFRDPEAWESLAPHLDELARLRPKAHVLRAWVPGCATGEEAYSLAIALRECSERVERRHEVQIFGTDLDNGAIDVARVGQYPAGIAVDVSQQRLERHFSQEDSTYQIHKSVRETVVFAPQNVIKDPPFTKLDVVSCRNLLIYLNGDLQTRLLQIFHYALLPGGLLLLGPSETIGSSCELFEPLDTRWKIFRRKESIGAVRRLPQLPPQAAAGREESRGASAATDRENQLSTLVQRLLLARFAPASVVVNDRGEILFIHGRTGAYLEPSSGEPRNNVLEMAREGLQVELAAAMRECLRKGADVVREAVRVRANGGFAYADLAVSRITEPEAVRGLLLLTFRPASPPPSPPRPARQPRKSAGDSDPTAQLEQELKRITESHQTTLEELETSNEELKSTNEELQSTNEELQSTNEELETSKEEMQSLNEELTTVNTELQAKVEELSQANDDMQNLLNSTDIATIFLDNELNIKRFTEQARELVTLRKADVGRPISELASSIKSDHLDDDCRQVLRTLIFKEEEVETTSGGCYLMRIMPYRTAENVIDGLVMTFVDIGPLRRAERLGARAKADFEGVIDTVREPLLLLNADLRVVSANQSFYRTFRSTVKQTEGELLYELGSSQWDVPKLRQLLDEILPRNAKFEDYEVEVEVPRLGRRVFALNARRLERPEDQGDLILLALEDMTNR